MTPTYRAVLALAALLLPSAPAVAADFLVDRLDDAPAATACDAAVPNDCSLRGAVTAANGLLEASGITVPAGRYLLTQSTPCTHRFRTCAFVSCTVTTSQASLCLTGRVALLGAGAADTIIDGGQLASVVLVSADADAELRDLTITRGHATVGGGMTLDVGAGGGINNQGTLAVIDAVVASNSALALGGGIYTAGDLSLTRSTVRSNLTTDNFSEGGGLFLDRDTTVTVADSEIRDNGAEYHGGGISLSSATVAIRGSAVSGNTARFLNGGGIQTFAVAAAPAHLTIANSTISGNQAGRDGGGLNNNPYVLTSLDSVTITANTAAAGTFGRGGGVNNEHTNTLALEHTIIAGNTVMNGGSGGPECGVGTSPLTSIGYNLIGNTAQCTIVGVTTGNLVGVAPGLAPLSDNGGPSRTHSPLADGPAVDAGNPAGCTDADGIPLTTDQRGAARTTDGNGDGTSRCDIGAVELAGSGGSGATVSSVQPREGGTGGSVMVVVHGTGFQSGAVVRLERAGHADVVGMQTNVGESGQVVMAVLDLAGRAVGPWDVVIENLDGTTGTAVAGFTIAAPRAPDVWVDVFGPPTVRYRGDTATGRHLLLYGNRGNQDAFAVPVIVGLAASVGMVPRFEIAPPPQQPGKIVIQDWGDARQDIIAADGPPLRYFMLLLPVVPAGFSGVLELGTVFPGSASGQLFTLYLERGAPLYAGGAPIPSAVATLVGGARDKAERVFRYLIPTSIDPDMTAYLNAQIETVVDDGTASLISTFGAAPKVYNLSQIAYDLAAFGMVTAQIAQADPLASWMRPEGAGWLAGLASFCAPQAFAQDVGCVCGTGPRGVICCPGCLCPKDDDTGPPPPPKPCLLRPKDPDCRPPETSSECLDMGWKVIRGRDKSGNDILICTSSSKCVLPNPVLASQCVKFPLRPVASSDPNDKYGPQGSGSARYLTSRSIALPYMIQFENKPAATAPAADVVVTDTLDASVMDLASLRLGPIGFGTTQVVPPPGSSAFTGDVDLRPATNLVVRIEAGLDPQTSVLSWRFTSLDPVTLLPPEDASAGFLPPNLTPPEGDGYVSFTVDAKPGLASGTAIANDARIVFDANAPIDTPVWQNVLDVVPPTSQVTSVVSAGACSQSLRVAWTGSDEASGIGAYTILVSEDGGPFEPWLETVATSATFHGRWGGRYVFQSIAEDDAGNLEQPPFEASTAGEVAACGPFDLAVTKVTAPRKIGLTRRESARTAMVNVQIQNRSVTAQTIPDAATLARLVGVRVDALGACAAASIELHAGKPQKPLPFVLKSKGKLNVVFDVRLDCVTDPQTGAGHEDYRIRATVDQTVLGGIDAHPTDDLCPRVTSPAIKDPYPNGKIAEKGCGEKLADGTLGGPVLVDLGVK